VGLPAIYLRDAPEYFEEGQRAELLMDESSVVNHSTGERYTFAAFDPMVRQILSAGGRERWLRGQFA
jgi:hypothetical protein